MEDNPSTLAAARSQLEEAGKYEFDKSDQQMKAQSGFNNEPSIVSSAGVFEHLAKMSRIRDMPIIGKSAVRIAQRRPHVARYRKYLESNELSSDLFNFDLLNFDNSDEAVLSNGPYPTVNNIPLSIPVKLCLDTIRVISELASQENDLDLKNRPSPPTLRKKNSSSDDHASPVITRARNSITGLDESELGRNMRASSRTRSRHLSESRETVLLNDLLRQQKWHSDCENIKKMANELLLKVHLQQQDQWATERLPGVGSPLREKPPRSSSCSAKDPPEHSSGSYRRGHEKKGDRPSSNLSSGCSVRTEPATSRSAIERLLSGEPLSEVAPCNGN